MKGRGCSCLVLTTAWKLRVWLFSAVVFGDVKSGQHGPTAPTAFCPSFNRTPSTHTNHTLYVYPNFNIFLLRTPVLMENYIAIDALATFTHIDESNLQVTYRSTGDLKINIYMGIDL